MDLAARCTLLEPSVFIETTRRMLADVRVYGGLLEALASQWLRTRSVISTTPDVRFPFSPSIAAAMQRETLLVLADVLRSDRPFGDIVDLPYTFVDAQLAAHYGLPFDATRDADDGAVDGFVKVDTLAVGRLGVMSHGAFLTSTSASNRTSPVRRGGFVVRELLCIDPGLVPADVPAIDENEAAGSLRERMEQHRSNPSCATCHVLMDPIGFGLESFDVVGRMRTVDLAGFAIEDDDVFFGTSFDGPAELARVIKAQPQLSTCLADHVTSYAINRTLSSLSVPQGHPDACMSQAIASASGGGSLREVIEAIVLSPAFLSRAPDDS